MGIYYTGGVNNYSDKGVKINDSRYKKHKESIFQ